MKLRCKQGDLAVVIYDTAPCVQNLGRIVEVRGPVKPYPEMALPSWLIKPAQPTPFVVECGNEVHSEIVDWASRVRHPDAWLLPLRTAEDGESADESTDTTKGEVRSTSNERPNAKVPVTSMNYRPHSYFGIADLEVELLGRVKGVMRREALKGILDQGRLTGISDFLTKAALDDVERELSGRRHPMFMGGEYLPTVTQNEVEIARICIKSTTYDVTSVYARRVGQRIRYRVVDEYGGDTLTGRTTRTSIQPLTMAQLIMFFMGAWDLWQCLERNYQDNLEGMLDFFDGQSAYYPCFDPALRSMVNERFTEAQSA